MQYPIPTEGKPTEQQRRLTFPVPYRIPDHFPISLRREVQAHIPGNVLDSTMANAIIAFLATNMLEHLPADDP